MLTWIIIIGISLGIVGAVYYLIRQEIERAHADDHDHDHGPTV
jgi:hypothetical protein